MKHNGRIAYETIVAAKNGDDDAIEEILRHYAPYISYFSKRQLHDENGNCYEYVDKDVKHQIEVEYILKVILHYDINRLPEGETLEQ